MLMKTVIASIRTLFTLVFVVLILILTLPYMWLVGGLQPKTKWVLSDRFVKNLVRFALLLLGVRVELRGEPLSEAPVMFVGNHTSNMDVAVAIAHLPTPKAYVAKIEMKKIPILSSWMIRLGSVFVDRDNMRQQVKTLRIAQDQMESGLSYLVFPEGTRSEKRVLLDFKPGAFRMATKTDTPIQPIGFCGVRSIMRKGSPVIYSGTVVIHVGKPVTATADYDKDTTTLAGILRSEVRRLTEEAEGMPYPFAEELVS